MSGHTSRELLLFAGIGVVFLIFTAFYPNKNNIYHLSDQSSSIAPPLIEENTSQQYIPFVPISPPILASNNGERVTNNNCGISFVLPEGWTIMNLQEGNRYCQYRIKNPNKRGATLEVGVPNFLYPSEEVVWNSLLQVVREKTDLKPMTSPNIDEVLFSERIAVRPSDPNMLIGIGDPMYLFRKGQASYYMRYGYVDFDGRNMLEDISSVISSIEFPESSTFYETPLRGMP